MLLAFCRTLLQLKYVNRSAKQADVLAFRRPRSSEGNCRKSVACKSLPPTGPEQRGAEGREGRNIARRKREERGGRRKRAKRGQKGRKEGPPHSVRPFSLARPKFLGGVDPAGLRRESQCGASFLPPSALPVGRVQSEVGPSGGNRPRSCLPFLIVQGQDAAAAGRPSRRRGGWCGGGRVALWTFLLLPLSLSLPSGNREGI